MEKDPALWRAWTVRLNRCNKIRVVSKTTRRTREGKKKDDRKKDEREQNIDQEKKQIRTEDPT